MKQKFWIGVISILAVMFLDTAVMANAFEKQAFGWQEVEGKIYYVSPETGERVTGWQEVGGKTYYFSPKNGTMATGWQIKGKKLYYASKKGIVKRNTTYRGITFTATGEAADNFKTQYKIIMLQTLASVTDERMDKQAKLSACWSYLTGGKFRYASKYVL